MGSEGYTQPVVCLISETFVKPKYEVEDQIKPFYLGPIDLAILSLNPIQKGLLFDSKPKVFPSFLADLEQSLSLSLVHFYPLAGRLATQKFPDEHASWVYLDCIKGPGARLLHASVELSALDLLSSTDVHPMVRNFFDLGEKSVNHDGHSRPLLSIQVTELLDGIFIGFTMNHSVLDGTSYWHFISSLSEIFLNLQSGKIKPNDVTSISISKRPTYGPFFPRGCGPILKLPYLEPEVFISRFEPGPLRERIFHFSSAAVAKLKVQANKECVSTSSAQNISSFQALCAFVWRCVTRARNLCPEEETTCALIVNYRTRIDPPLSETSFGNFINRARSSCKAGELLGRNLGWAATLVHQGVRAKDDKAVRGFLSWYANAPFVVQPGPLNPFHKPNCLLVGGSTRFDTYGPEFGLGKALAVIAGYPNKEDGKVTASPGRQEGGSVDLEVCLKPEIMDALESDVEYLSSVSLH